MGFTRDKESLFCWLEYGASRSGFTLRRVTAILFVLGAICHGFLVGLELVTSNNPQRNCAVSYGCSFCCGDSHPLTAGLKPPADFMYGTIQVLGGYA